MLTDIPSVSQGILGRNVASNLASFARQCKQQQGVTAPSRQDLAEEGSGLGINRPWRQSTPLGAGSCAVGTLDFTRPVAEQVRNKADHHAARRTAMQLMFAGPLASSVT